MISALSFSFMFSQVNMMFLVLLWANVPNVVALIRVQNVLLHCEVILFTTTCML